MNFEAYKVLAPVAALLIALLVSVWVIPVMIRLAPKIGMIDKPDPRKVHTTPVARVGGIGIAAGAITAMLVFAPRNDFTTAFIAGAAILVAFGAWDDARELGHYPKFIGQIAAAVIVIWLGGVSIEQLPFLSGPLPGWDRQALHPDRHRRRHQRDQPFRWPRWFGGRRDVAQRGGNVVSRLPDQKWVVPHLYRSHWRWTARLHQIQHVPGQGLHGGPGKPVPWGSQPPFSRFH